MKKYSAFMMDITMLETLQRHTLTNPLVDELWLSYQLTGMSWTDEVITSSNSEQTQQDDGNDDVPNLYTLYFKDIKK